MFRLKDYKLVMNNNFNSKAYPDDFKRLRNYIVKEKTWVVNDLGYRDLQKLSISTRINLSKFDNITKWFSTGEIECYNLANIHKVVVTRQNRRITPMLSLRTRYNIRAKQLIANQVNLASRGIADITISLGVTPRVTWSEWDNWNYYSKSYKHAYKQHDLDVVYKPFSLVLTKEYSVVDGIPTFAVYTSHTINGVTVLKADWLERGRGSKLFLTSGYIACQGKFAYHAITLRQAIAGVTAKISKGFSLKNLSLDSKLTAKDYHDLTGACYAGIKSFKQEFGIKTSIAVRELLPMLKGRYGYDSLLKIVK